MCLQIMRLSVHFSHVSDEVEHLVGVSDLIVVPRNDLHELIGEVNTGDGVEDRGQGAAEEVGRYDSVFGLAEDALEFAF